MMAPVIVCHCEAVNDQRVVEEVLSGAGCPEAVAARCGAGARCGGCVPTIEALLEAFGLAEQPAA
jgi:bacterioferritin-associated ferredoxin